MKSIDLKQALKDKTTAIWENTLLRPENRYIAICFTGTLFCWLASPFLPKNYVFLTSLPVSIIFWETAKNLLLQKQISLKQVAQLSSTATDKKDSDSYFLRLRKASFRPTIISFVIVAAILAFRYIFNN